MNFYWERDEALDRLDKKMTTAFHAVQNVAEEDSLYTRNAAYVVAIDRVVSAMRFRGWL